MGRSSSSSAASTRPDWTSTASGSATRRSPTPASSIRPAAPPSLRSPSRCGTAIPTPTCTLWRTRAVSFAGKSRRPATERATARPSPRPPRKAPLRRGFSFEKDFAGRSASAAEELAHDAQEVVQPVVVQPVAGALDADDARVAEVRGAAVGRPITRPALLAVEEQGRAPDPTPQGLDVASGHVVRRKRAHVVVELPGIRAVLVLVRAVHGEVARLLGAEMRVFLLHAPEGVLDARIAPGQPARERALLADPLVHARLDRFRLALGQPLGRRSEALDGHEPRDAVRVDAGITERDVAAERVRDDRHGRQPLLVDELGEVVDVAGHRVAAVGGPLAVAVAAKSGRDDVPGLAPRPRRPGPVATVGAPALHDHQRRRV